MREGQIKSCSCGSGEIFRVNLEAITPLRLVAIKQRLKTRESLRCLPVVHTNQPFCFERKIFFSCWKIMIIFALDKKKDIYLLKKI